MGEATTVGTGVPKSRFRTLRASCKMQWQIWRKNHSLMIYWMRMEIATTSWCSTCRVIPEVHTVWRVIELSISRLCPYDFQVWDWLQCMIDNLRTNSATC